MIRIERKRMTYTYFHAAPDAHRQVTHLHALSAETPAGMKQVPFQTMVIDLTVPDFVQHWSSSTRHKISKARKEQLAVDRGAYLLPDILQLFNPRAIEKGLRGYTEQHFAAFPHIECSAIYFEDVLICGHVWLIDREAGRALLYVNASNYYQDNETKSFTGRAHYFLLWQDGLFLRTKGIRVMDLMGYEAEAADPGLTGVFQWKAGTHGSVEMTYHYYPVWFYMLRRIRHILSR